MFDQYVQILKFLRSMKLQKWLYIFPLLAKIGEEIFPLNSKGKFSLVLLK